MDYPIIPHSRTFLSDMETQAVAAVLKSGQLSQGPMVNQFETEFANYIGKKKAAATSSGTSALHLVLLALDVKEKDEVIIPSFVCPAVLNAVNYTGAIPRIVDIDPLTYNISVDDVKNAISEKTKAIIVHHMFGCPAEIDRLSELRIPIIEDCAQSVGADFRGQKVGSFGFVSVFSFYATKVFTSGEGGMVLSDSEDLISKIRDLREYDNRSDYSLRYNYKMTDMQAALGLTQLVRLENFLFRRKEIASRYIKEFNNCCLSLPAWKEGKEHIYYRFVVKTTENSSNYLKKLHTKKIMCLRPVFTPLHVYLNLSGFPHTEESWQKTVSIPLYPSLTEVEIDRIVSAVQETFI